MRLTSYQRNEIISAVHAIDADATIYLFGSRVNDDARGGDIDLLIHSQCMNAEDRRNLRMRLCDQLGEQKFDIVLTRDFSEPFARIARDEGVAL